MTTGRSPKWHLENLLARTPQHLFELWKTVSAPDFQEIDGEYSGYFPDGGDPAVRARLDGDVFNEMGKWPGYWLGKAFKPVTDTTGEGYNHWRKAGRIIRHTRFATELRDSVIDGRPALVFYYSAFNNEFGQRDTIDEIRKLDDRLYVVAATVALPDGKRSEPSAFMLAGPTWPWFGVDDESAELK